MLVLFGIIVVAGIDNPVWSSGFNVDDRFPDELQTGLHVSPSVGLGRVTHFFGEARKDNPPSPYRIFERTFPSFLLTSSALEKFVYMTGCLCRGSHSSFFSE